MKSSHTLPEHSTDHLSARWPQLGLNINSRRSLTLLFVLLCGFLESGKCKRVSMGELIQAPTVFHVCICCGRLPLALAVPALLCCCSHPLAGTTDKPHLVLYDHITSLSVTEVGGQQVPLLHNALLTEQHNKIPLIVECWVIYQTCLAPVRTMTQCSWHCTESSLWNRCNSLRASENKECIFFSDSICFCMMRRAAMPSTNWLRFHQSIG